MKTLVGLLAVVCLLCPAVNAQEAVGSVGYPALNEVTYSYYGGGARAMAMGYANVGLANDVSSGLWNPAGLWILEDVQMAASYNFFDPVGTFTHNLSDDPVENDFDVNAIGHFSFAAPVRIKGHPFVFNFNYDRRNDFALEAGVVQGPVTVTQEDRGYLQVFDFGGSTRIYKQLSLGLLLNIYDGRRVKDEKSIFTRDTVINDVYNIVQTKVSSNRMVDSTTSNAVNFTTGFMLKGEKFSVGATVQTPYTLKHSTDRTFLLLTTNDGFPSVDESDTVYVLDSLAKQDIPLSVAFGVGMYPMERLTLTLDVNYQNYGSTNWYYRTGFAFDAGGDRSDSYDEIPIDWNNTMGIGAGVEYVFNTGIGRVPLRGGFRFDQLAQPKNFSISYDNVDYDTLGNAFQLDQLMVTRVADGRQSEYSFSLGTGIAWSKIEFDFAYRYTTGGEANVTESYTLYADDGDDGVVTGGESVKWENKTHEFRVTFTGYF